MEGNAKFQLHSGAIEGIWSVLQHLKFSLFQLHSGAIEGPTSGVVGRACYARFNSILVLLRVGDTPAEAARLWKFQLHSGAIEGVRLLRMKRARVKVSTPFWCY